MRNDVPLCAGLIFSVGLSNLQYVDLSRMRNAFVPAIAIFIGLAVPSWIKENARSIKTGALSLCYIRIRVLRITRLWLAQADFCWWHRLRLRGPGDRCNPRHQHAGGWNHRIRTRQHTSRCVRASGASYWKKLLWSSNHKQRFFYRGSRGGNSLGSSPPMGLAINYSKPEFSPIIWVFPRHSVPPELKVQENSWS